MKFFNISAIDEAGLVHAQVLLVNENVAILIMEDLLKNLSYNAPRLNVQIACTGATK